MDVQQKPVSDLLVMDIVIFQCFMPHVLVGSFTRCAIKTISFMLEGLSDSRSLIEAIYSDVATTGDTHTGTVKQQEVLDAHLSYNWHGYI